MGVLQDNRLEKVQGIFKPQNITIAMSGYIGRLLSMTTAMGVYYKRFAVGFIRTLL